MNQSMAVQNQTMMPSYQQNMMSPTPFNQSSFNMTQQPRDNFPLQIEYSAKHNGVYIYVGRILSPIWNLKCVTKSMTPDNKEFVSGPKIKHFKYMSFTEISYAEKIRLHQFERN